MCGVSGFCDYKQTSDSSISMKMSDSLKHRGPDAGNIYFQNFNDFNIGLGHRRLSIIDLSEKATQPMEFDNFIIVYNGEVYNFKELRKELEISGYSFTSNSDTEVVLKAFHCWGEEALNKFNGMFAFCIYDKINFQFYLARDRAGVKPLFYYFDEDTFLFASELKAFSQNPQFKKELDFDSLGIYLNLGYIPTPYSIFKNTYKLRPGSILKFSIKNKEYVINEYWRIEDYYNLPKTNKTEAEILEYVEDTLINSLKLRLISDVPIGLFLSGGYDSTLLGAILKNKLNTELESYTVGVADRNFDESVRAAEIAKHLGLKHQIHTITEKDGQNILLDFPIIYDEPYADTSGIPTIFLSSLIKNDGIKVVLTGDGAEETFAGYDIYFRNSKMLEKVKHLPRLLKKILLQYFSQNRFIRKYPKDYFTYINDYWGLNANSPLSFHHPLLNTESNIRSSYFNLFPSLNNFNTYHDKLLARDFRTRMLDDFICKIDRGTMSKSIEAREPYLDYRLIEFLAKIPTTLKCRNSHTKYLLKELTHKFVPKLFMNKPKMGFAIPIDSWLRGELKFLIDDYLDDSVIAKKEYINPKQVRYLKDGFIKQKLSPGERYNFIYLLLFEMWYKRWISNN